LAAALVVVLPLLLFPAPVLLFTPLLTFLLALLLALLLLLLLLPLLVPPVLLWVALLLASGVLGKWNEGPRS